VLLEEAQPAAILEDGIAHGRQLHRGVGLAGTKGRMPLVGGRRRAAAAARGSVVAAAGSVVAAAPAAMHPSNVAGAYRAHSMEALTREFIFQTSNFMISEAAGLSRAPPPWHPGEHDAVHSDNFAPVWMQMPGSSNWRPVSSAKHNSLVSLLSPVLPADLNFHRPPKARARL
jgi:hypothetical protein